MAGCSKVAPIPVTAEASRCSRIMAMGRLASNCFDAWVNAGFIVSSHMEERILTCCTIN